MISQLVKPSVTSIQPVDKVEGKIYDFEDAERKRREIWVSKQVFLNPKYQVIRNPLDPRLYAPNKKVKNISGVTETEMAKTLVGRHIIEGGLGLAAPQIGLNWQMFVMNIPGSNPQQYAVMFNPRIVLAPDELGDDNVEFSAEGCISHPGTWLEIARLKKVTIIAQTIHTPRARKYTFEGMAARIVQHEISHLEGKLITDMPANCKRAMNIDRKGQELLQEENRKAEEFGFVEPEAE